MYTQKQAEKRALRAAKTFDTVIYIIRDYTPDWPIKSYGLSLESELDSYYAGCPIVAIVYPSGKLD